MLRLNCFIQVADAAYDAVLEEAKALTAASLKEEGCIFVRRGVTRRHWMHIQPRSISNCMLAISRSLPR